MERDSQTGAAGMGKKKDLFGFLCGTFHLPNVAQRRHVIPVSPRVRVTL